MRGLRRVDQTLLIKGHCTETIMCRTLTTNINAYVEHRIFFNMPKGAAAFQEEEKKKHGWKL